MFISEIILLITLLCCVGISACDVRLKNQLDKVTSKVPYVGLIVAAIFLIVTFNAVKDSYFTAENISFKGLLIQDMYVVSGITQFLKLCSTVIVLIATMLTLRSKEIQEALKLEYIVLLLAMLAGTYVQISSTNLILTFVSGEVIALSLILLISLKYKDTRSTESASKAYYQAIMGSIIFAVAITVVYWLTKSFDMAVISKKMTTLAADTNNHKYILVSFVLLLIAIVSKMNAFPFNFTISDSVEGAPIPAGLALLTLPLMGAIATLYHFILNTFCLHSETKWVPHLAVGWNTVFSVIGIASIAMGSIGAINQSKIKRFISMISVAQIGFLILSFVTGAPAGIGALLMNILVYVISLAGFFILLQILSDGKSIENINELSGVVPKTWFHSLLVVVFVINIIGVPPLSGFFAKFYTVGALFKTNMVWVSTLLVGIWTLLFGASINLFKTMFKNTESKESIPLQLSIENAALVFLGLMVVYFGIFGDSTFRIFINILE